MRVLLIDPPYGFEEIGGAKQTFKHVLNKIPSLGLAYLAAVAEEKGHAVKIVDCTLGLGHRQLVAVAEEFNPQIIGVTATTPTFNNAVFVIDVLRKVFPQATFICGGPHPTASPEEALNTGVFDFLVLGEGEETFLELIAYVENKQQCQVDNILGIAFKRDSKLIITSPRSRIDNLDSLPFPARHLLPALSTYRPTPASYRRLPVAVIMTSRGCPHRCTFCDRAVFGEKFRRRSVSNVMAEVEEVIYKYGAKEIRFFDDTFTLDPAHVEGICKAMKKLRLGIPWTCLTSITALSFNILKMMHESGCWQILFGLESGDDYVLKHLEKGNTVKQNKEAVFLAKKAGLSIRADFLVGSPWETKESLQKTLAFAMSLPLDFAHFNKFVPYPGTDIYKDLTARGHKFVFDRAAFINNQTETIYVSPAFAEVEYIKLLNRAYKAFYLRPGSLLRKLLSIRTLPEFVGHLKGFYSIFSL